MVYVSLIPGFIPASGSFSVIKSLCCLVLFQNVPYAALGAKAQLDFDSVGAHRSGSHRRVLKPSPASVPRKVVAPANILNAAIEIKCGWRNVLKVLAPCVPSRNDLTAKREGAGVFWRALKRAVWSWWNRPVDQQPYFPHGSASNAVPKRCEGQPCG